MQKNWDKWKSILKINDVTTFLLCILHKFKKYKKKGCISQKRISVKIMLDERNDIWYYKQVEESRVSTLTLAQSSD